MSGIPAPVYCFREGCPRRLALAIYRGQRWQVRPGVLVESLPASTLVRCPNCGGWRVLPAAVFSLLRERRMA